MPYHHAAARPQRRKASPSATAPPNRNLPSSTVPPNGARSSWACRAPPMPPDASSDPPTAASLGSAANYLRARSVSG